MAETGSTREGVSGAVEMGSMSEGDMRLRMKWRAKVPKTATP